MTYLRVISRVSYAGVILRHQAGLTLEAMVREGMTIRSKDLKLVVGDTGLELRPREQGATDNGGEAEEAAAAQL